MGIVSDLTNSGLIDLGQEKYFRQSAMNVLHAQQAAMLRHGYEQRMSGRELEAKAISNPAKTKPKSFREELQQEVDSWLKDAA